MENNEIQQFSSEKFNKKYKDIFELCPIPYMVVGHLGNILQFNNAAAYTFGISHKPVGSASIFQILTKESESQFRLLFKQAFELREKQELELVFINHKREKIIAKTNFVSYFDGDKNQDLCLMTMVDITQRKQIELSLLQSERLLLHSQKIANLGSWDWNIQTNETYWSDQLYEIYGRRKEDGVPHIDDWTNTIHPDDREYLVQNIENALKGIQKYDVEYRIFKKNNGELRIIHAIGEVVYDKEGQPLRLFGVAQDVTDRKNKEEQLKELNNTKDKFFSIIAHDLKSPFSGLMGLSEFMLRYQNKLSPEKIVECTQIIYDTTKQTYSLLESLLTWSRTQTNRISFEPEKIELKFLVNDIIMLFSRNNYNTKAIKISGKIVPEDLQVLSDKDMLQTIFRNLVSNAIKFTPEGGIIKIACESYNENEVICSVSDTGIGISEENQKKLFKIEHSFSTKGIKNERGTGLGLILCKEFVEKNGGKIWVKSEKGRGSTFYFILKIG